MSKNLQDYHMVVAAKDRHEINHNYLAMRFFIYKREPVPYQFVEGFLELLWDSEQFNYDHLDRESDKLASIADARLASFEGYSFGYKEKETEVTFKEILWRCIRGYLQMSEKIKIKSRIEVIRFFYVGLTECFKPNFSPEQQKAFGRRKAVVVSAVLTEICWASVTDKDPTIENLYQAAKYAALKQP